MPSSVKAMVESSHVTDEVAGVHSVLLFSDFQPKVHANLQQRYSHNMYRDDDPYAKRPGLHSIYIYVDG